MSVRAEAAEQGQTRARNDLKVPFGLREGVLYSPSEVERGLKCGCVCPDSDCNSPLVANQPRASNRRDYFSHHIGGKNCHGVETAIHMMGKAVLQQGMTLHLPRYRHNVGAETTIHIRGMSDVFVSETFEPQVYGTVVHEREIVPGIRPDAQVFIDGWEKPLLIEIKVNHAVGDEKITALREAGYRTIEIDLSPLVGTADVDRDEISQKVHEKADRHWLVEPTLDARLFELRSRLKRQIEIELADEREPAKKREEQALLVEQQLEAQRQAQRLNLQTPAGRSGADKWLQENHPHLHRLLERALMLPLPGHKKALPEPWTHWQMYILKAVLTSSEVDAHKLRAVVSSQFSPYGGAPARRDFRYLKNSPQGKAVSAYLMRLWEAGLLAYGGESTLVPVFRSANNLERWLQWSLDNNDGLVFRDRKYKLLDLLSLTRGRSSRILQSAENLNSASNQHGRVCARCSVLCESGSVETCRHCGSTGELVPVAMTETYLRYIREKAGTVNDLPALSVMKAPRLL